MAFNKINGISDKHYDSVKKYVQDHMSTHSLLNIYLLWRILLCKTFLSLPEVIEYLRNYISPLPADFLGQLFYYTIKNL
ncbi:hypothetical protein F8M41_023102 [Gigaspora margarita]|uniref:Uncharacterized protein n=1 Tax=Gigaspora margarita TaxID=4874 RepID=A0A8H4ADX2_GIGMA|nr:hypothetical protein F8M41_023102 [Gigaspora margarita]